MGEILWTGGYIEKLRRIDIGHIDIKNEEHWIQHNDISYAPLRHEELFPGIPVLELSEPDKKQLRLGSTPIPTDKKNGHYFVTYDNDGYGLLEAREGSLFPIKNAV
jgi:tRNA U55 pseudouridine synthase TruB